MKVIRVVRGTGRGLAAILLAVTLSGSAVSVAAAPTQAPTRAHAQVPAQTAAPGQTAAGDAVPTRAEQVRETGSWAAHGHTLDLHADGTGVFAVWHGAFDGTRVQVALIPAPGPATVAEVTAVEQIGAGALGPDDQPGVGGLVTLAFAPAGTGAPEARTAHVEWTAGPHRHTADLCPVAGLDAREMAELGCGA